MAQFVTHIQPTLLEASQGHVPHHHGHQVGMQHTSHLPHSGHNMPSPPTSHNHHPHSHHQQHQEQQHHNHRHSPPSQLSSPPSGAPIHHYHMGKHGAKHEHFGHHSSGDGNTSFLRAARAGNLERVLEHLKNNIDINTSNTNGLNALHLASKDGHTHVVSELLKRGAIVDSATKKGNTALHIASLAGQEEVVKLLLEHNAAVNVQSQNGFTPLYMAAQENHDSVVKLLLANGANQSLATEDGFTPLAVAMQQGHDKVVAVLLESDTRGKVRLPALHIAAKKDDVKAATLLLDNDHNPDVTSKSGFTPLHIASHYGNQAIATLLIQKGADVNFAAKHNISPLHVAAKWGKTNMVSLLLEKGANIEAKTRDGLTPLHCAARSGHEQVVDMLLERGAPISAKTKNGLAPLHMAAQGEHVDAARILLYHRAPVDEVTVDYLTALHVAAHCGHVRVAKLLLDRNADANARALNGFTPLHIACKKNRIKVVELLLRHGASISATTESGLTPLHVAAFMGCMNIVIYLLQHDASPDVPTVRGETPLHLAARANQTDIIRILLRNGAQVDARAREQQTPLHIASRLGNVDIVMLLLQHGAQVDATTKDMYTALHIAAKEGQDEVAAVLIENGAALDAATKKGFTPLHLTAKYGHIKVAQLLLQKEADVDAQGKNGVTPLHVACHYDNQKVALLLLEKGASPHAIAKNGHTPLHIAARKNQMDIATTLLEYGAQANAESKAGFTPLHLSCQEGHAEISNLLIEHKAGVNHPAKNGLTPMHLCAQEDNVNVAEILQRNGANIDMATKAGYTPLHVAAHFGQANMVRFLLHHGANVDAATSIGYTPLHQTAQQGHCHIVNLLLEHKANANAQTVNGQTPLHIARKLGYISVLDSLKSITNEPDAAAQTQTDEKYRVVAPEAMHESFMSDSEEEGGEDNMLSDQPYRYLTVDEMKSLGDDSLPIDVTRDERIDSNRMMTHSAEYAGGVGGPSQPQAIAEELISPHKAQVHGIGKSYVDGIYMGNGLNEEQKYMSRKLSWKSFLVSFLVDARGGAMRGCRHSGVRMIIPSRSTCQPTRVTCRYVKPQRTMHPPQLMEGEALASRVLELGPVSTKFIGPVIMEVPHFASLRGKEREIIILRSDNGETWREHTVDNSEEIMHDVLQQCFEPEEIAQLEEQGGNHVCRFVTYDFPQYFAVVSRIRQEVHAIGPEGGMVSSTVVPQVQAVFPQGALTKKIKVGLQAQPVDPDLTAKLLGRGVAVSPIVTVEPRRRKFHKAITLSMPAPKAHSQGMINQYSGNTPTLRLLCSITGVFRKRSLKGGPSRAQWEDVTGSTPLTFVNDCVSFTTTVSARFWLMDCRNISEATKMATELYKEVIHVPFMAKFVVFAKKVEPYEARLRVFCMTDDREDKTLEKQELFTEVAKSRDVEVLEGKPQYIEMAGNLVPVTKSGDQLQLQFKAFRENRLPFTVRVKDQHADIVGRTLFMKEPKVAKGEPPQHPICILNIVLPDIVIPDTTTEFSDKITTTYRSSLFSLSKHQNDHYIGDIRIVDLSNLLGKDWIQLASEIGISTEEIDDIINQNTDSIARQAQSMIRLFKDKPNYDIHALEDALKNIGREDIMKKCKSGRLSHSRDFDETDIMKNSESVEELVRQESKRIQQIHDHEEVKYSAEEKEVEESESDEEITKRTVAERREKIVKRLSIERQIPASSQKKEISREISEIKRKSLIEDKKAIHESEIMMQLPTDNIVKSTVAPDQVMKMKMGKMDAAEISKSDFDKELTHKLKTSGRSSEEEDSATEYKTVEDDENLKIVQDISAVEKSKKLQDSPMESGQDTTKQLTEDFLNAEKQTQLPVDITFSEKFVEEVKEKEMKSTELDEKSSQKIEKIISVFESGKSDEKDGTVSKTSTITETIQVVTEGKVKGTSIEDKIADFEAKGVTYDMKSVLPKDIKKYEDTHADDLYEAHQEPIKSFEKTITEDFLALEQKSQMSPAIKSIQEITTAVQLPKDNADVIESAPAAPVAEKRTSLSEKSSEPITRSSIEIQSSKFSIPDGKEEKVFPKTTETIKEFEKHIEKDSEIATSELSYMEQRSQKEITKTASEFVTSTAAVLETTADSFEITTDLELPVKEAERTKAQLKEVTKEWDGITLTGIQKTSGDLTKPEHIEDKLTTEQVTTVFKSKDSSMEPRSVAKTEVITTTTYLDKTEAKVIKDSEIDDLIEFTKQREGAKETQVESKTVKTTQILNIFETESDSSTIQSAVGDIAADTKITSEILKTGKEISTIEPKELSSAFSGERDPLDMRFDDTKHEQTTKKLTQDFLLMEQQKQLPYSKESQAEDEKFELLKSATHTVVPSILSSTVVPAIPTDLNVKQEPTSLVDVQATLPDIASKEGQPTMDDTHTVETKSAMSDLIKSTSVIMATVPKVSTEEAIISLEESLTDIKREEKPVQLPTASKKFTQGSQPETTPKDFEPEIIIDEKTTTLKMSSAVTDTVKEESIKLVESIKKLEETIKVVDKHQDDGIELAAPVNETDKVSAVGIRKLTEDFLTIEQTKQFSTSTKPVRETIVTDDHEKSTVSTTYEKPEVKADSFSSLQSAGLSEEITKIVTEAATKIDAIKMTNDFLATEQSTQLPIVKQTSEQTADQLDTQISPKSALDLAAPAPVEPRKSITLTDAEFCKSVEETITKKMSAGQIEICDELKTSASDIPHSQTPPPTPIDTRTERQEEESLPRAKFVEKDNLSDTVVTLHKTTESTFERVSGISKIETIEEKLVLDEDSFRNIGDDVKEQILYAAAEDNVIEKLIDFDADADGSKDNIYKYSDVEDDDEKYSDDDDDDDDEDRSRKAGGEKLLAFDTNIRQEAAVLIDNVLEESINIISTRQQQQHQQQEANGYDSFKQEYNSESENYAITCDDIGGLDVIKSPTIESMSGKSFDDNMSFTDEQWPGTQQHHTQVSAVPGVATTTITTASTSQQQKRSHDLIDSKDGFKPVTATETIETITTLTTTTTRQIGTTLHEAVTFGGSGGISDVDAADAVVEEADWKTKGTSDPKHVTEDSGVAKSRRIDHKFEKLTTNFADIDEQASAFDANFDTMVQDDEISNLQSEFSKMSWDDSVSPTTNTLGDIGQNTPDNDIQDIATETGFEFAKSSETTPVPTSAPTSAPTGHDAPTPKPRAAKSTSPVRDIGDDLTQYQKSDDAHSITDSSEILPDLSISAPVPKPRLQMKPTDSFKNLAALVNEQSDSISLRSLDITDDISKTDEVSTEISIKSSHARDYPTTTTITTASEDRTESLEPTSEISIDDAEVDTEKSELSEGRSKTSFYIGESSRNVIIKTTPTKPDTDIESSPEAVTTKDQALEGAIEAKDVALMKEISVDSDESNDVFKEFVTMKRETDEGESKIVRQGSETRNDLLEQEPTKEKQDDSNKSCETFVITADISQPADEKKETILKQSLDDYESLKLGSAKSDKLDLELEKSEWETTEKGIPIAKPKVVHSPQQLSELPRALIDEQMVARTLEEAQESLNAANNELKFIVKDGKSIKESPSEFEFRSISNTLISAEKKDKTVTDESLMQKEIKEPKFLEEEYISSFIGIPDTLKETQPPSTFEPIKSYEGTFEERTKETLNKEAVITHYTQGNVDDTKEELKDEHGSLGFISTGTADDYSSMEAYATKEEHASLGFVSTETVEDFSSMEDYYQEKIAKASFVTEGDDLRRSPIEVTKLGDTGVFSEICTEQTMKPFEEVTHRIKSETGSVDVTNRWSVPEIDQSSSSESYYKSFDKNDSRPLSSEVDNILTQGNSSEYQTALDVSSVTREATEYISAVSTLESSSGKTISSHESMKSFDSQSETSGNLGSIDVSELSETLVASSTEPDALEAEELSRIRDLRDDDDDSDESLDIQDYSKTEQQMQKSLMKRSQEMIFKPKTEEAKPEEKHFESVMVEEFPKPKEVEKTWGLAYPMDEAKIDDGKDTDRPEDILLYHSDIRRSIDDSKLASSLDEGSILSVSMSSTSNIETVVENFEDMIGSAGSSSLTGIEAFGFPHDEQASSFPEHEDTFTMEMDSKEHSPQDSAATTPPGESRKRGHKRSESTSITGDVLKSITDKDLPVVGENKESESESDTDPYESEYTRQFRSPNERKKNKKKQAAAEMDHSFDLEKRPFTPSQLVAEVIVEDSATEEMEAEAIEEERRPSQNMQDYSNIPDITVTEDFQKSPSLEENAEGFEEKSLYKVKTQEELHKAADEPLHQQKRMDKSEETFQKLVQEQYEQKLADLQRPQAGDIDYDDYDKAPDSPDSFEMIDQPDISDDFVIIEEVAKEADEADLGGKSIKIQPTKYESKHDEDVEKIIIKSAPADPKLGSQIFRDDLNFEFEESPPTAGSSSDPQDESDSGDMAASNKRWVEMQLTDSQLRYPYDITGGVLEDIKEEDGEFEVGSSRISSFKDSFSSTPEYDAMAARRYYARGEHDDLSMNSLQEFESLEQAISLENRNKTHQGSTDSSNGSFTRRYMVRHSGSATAQGDDISISSLKEFEGLENACIEAHLIEIKAKEEAAMLSRSDDSNKSNESDRENGASNIVVSKVTRTVTRTEVLPAQQQTIEALLKQKLEECEGRESMTKLTEMSTEPMEGKMKLDKQDSEKGSVDSLEINKSLDMRSSSIGSFEISKDATTRSDIDSLETDRKQPTREESIDSMENEQFDLLARFPTGETTLGEGLTTTTTTTTTTTDAEGHEHIVTQTITTTTSASGSTNLEFPTGQLHKDVSADSLCIEQTNTSSAGTTATYQTSAGNSQMSGSVTSCASSTLMEDSYPGANSSLTSSSFWSHEESTVVEDKNVLEEVLLEDAEALKRRQAQHRQEYDDQH
ncbi:ankyrin-2 isoform X3 [Bactrocera neohumeralis]|uniref:ankyrin-2 isoform X3 n=1 Tax=Bactrocera neohumeralis TaxID=98809 RepID=UPI0021668E26|nr:ankyrin-2 isoform X3 [Bactrocera neohumeralis]